MVKKKIYESHLPVHGSRGHFFTVRGHFLTVRGHFLASMVAYVGEQGRLTASYGLSEFRCTKSHFHMPHITYITYIIENIQLCEQSSPVDLFGKQMFWSRFFFGVVSVSKWTIRR